MALIRDPDEKRLRALMMLQYRLQHSATYVEIGKKFNLSAESVKNNLTWARKAGLVADAEDKILQELVPAAHKALLAALAKDDKTAAHAAIEIFKGVLPTFAGRKTPTVTSTGGDDLDTYLAQLRASETSDTPIISGELVEGEAQRALPAGETESPSQGDAESTGGIAVCSSSPEECPQEVGPGSDEGTGSDPQA